MCATVVPVEASSDYNHLNIAIGSIENALHGEQNEVAVIADGNSGGSLFLKIVETLMMDSKPILFRALRVLGGTGR